MDGMNGQNTMRSVRITSIKDSMNKRPNFDGESLKAAATVLVTNVEKMHHFLQLDVSL